jgi:hypothetical protein
MKMQRRKLPSPMVDAAIGYAAAPEGEGIAYARVVAAGAEHLLRLAFRVGHASALQPREAGYAAVTAVARALRARGLRNVRLCISDASLIADLKDRRELPPSIVIPNVRLRCALNALDDVRLEFAGENDLAQRARAEVILNAAA